MMTLADFGELTRRRSEPVGPVPAAPAHLKRTQQRGASHDWLVDRIHNLESVADYVTAAPTLQVPPPPPPPHRERMRQATEAERLVGVSNLAFKERREVRRGVGEELDSIVRQASSGHYDVWRQTVSVAEEQWQALIGNDEAVVAQEARRAVEAFGWPAEVSATTGTDRSSIVNVSVACPTPEQLLGDDMPCRTKSGAKTLRRWTKTDRNEAWARIIWTHMAAIGADVFTRCPAVTDVEITAFTSVAGENGIVARAVLSRELALPEPGRAIAGPELARLAEQGVVDAELATKGRTKKPAHLAS